MEAGEDDIRIVVCDDTDSFRAMLLLVLDLERDFVVVGEACNGEEAIEQALNLRPDVLLLDVAMPVMDGLEALPRIVDVAPDTCVVMLTGMATPAVREQALARGAARFIEKGIDIRQITDAVRSCATGRASA